ncbi:dUTP diphosphatase [Lysinibacillus sphaericus]|uniref:dUTP diphosphatase n=1 Tax=Lysinibacillus sphaericus TaxID=1421 RepID=UPI000563A3A4|nr:dUTP diphosphatase [Lysinibacillus sphaericus]QTB21598.1 dUTP diphosphatase [Lysinibacillus sphaericus]
MNLTKLFETQAALDEHIMQEHPELRGQNNLDWKLLALQVELGECANEWRGFKKWSKNQQPQTVILTTEGATNQNAVEYKCGDDECGFTFEANDGRLKDLWGDISDDCPICENGHLYALLLKNPLLEEYVDCLHFILSIGLELGANKWMKLSEYPAANENGSITLQFLDVHSKTLNIGEEIIRMELEPKEIRNLFTKAFESFLQLGAKLGFSWEQVEEAYNAKNKVNHERQNAGY